jgi:hypothetical protein
MTSPLGIESAACPEENLTQQREDNLNVRLILLNERQANRKRRAFTRFARGFDLTPVSVNDPFHEAEPDANTGRRDRTGRWNDLVPLWSGPVGQP